MSETNLSRANLAKANLAKANLIGVQWLDKARGLEKVKRWRGAKVERKWVERLGLDADKLNLEVVDNLERQQRKRGRSRPGP